MYFYFYGLNMFLFLHFQLILELVYFKILDEFNLLIF